MSCSSPFVYQVASEIITNEYQVVCSGSYTLNSYTVKWGGGNWCIGCAVSTQCWNGWLDLNYCGKTYWDNCCWGIEYPSWTIELWPTITFGGSISIPFEFESQAGVQITVDAPEGKPYQCQTIILKECDLSFSIDSNTYSLNIIPETIQLEEENGSFSINVPLESFSSKTTEWGLSYELTLDTTLEFCLNPTPPQGWINLLISCELSVSEDLDGLEFGTKTSFSISCPIVSVED
jgi:hypothetical protein